jgi:hypothetical protein
VQIEKGFTGIWLLPTGAQEARMRHFAGHKRFVWNRALSIEQARYRRGEKMVGCAAMMRQLTSRGDLFTKTVTLPTIIRNSSFFLQIGLALVLAIRLWPRKNLSKKHRLAQSARESLLRETP